MLHKHLVDGGAQSHEIALVPHLVMRGNLDCFLNQQSEALVRQKVSRNGNDPTDVSDNAL
jgi:hypothetical protein